MTAYLSIKAANLDRGVSPKQGCTNVAPRIATPVPNHGSGENSKMSSGHVLNKIFSRLSCDLINITIIEAS